MGGPIIDVTAVSVAIIAATPPTLAVVMAYVKSNKTGKAHLSQGDEVLGAMSRLETWAHEHEARDHNFEQYVHMRFHDILNQLSTLRSFHNVEGIVDEWKRERELRAGEHRPDQTHRDQFHQDEQ